MTSQQDRALSNLRVLLDQIPSLQSERGSERFKKWRRDTQVAIRRLFGQGSEHAKEFSGINFQYRPIAFVAGMEHSADYQRAYERGLQSATAMLKSMIEETESYGLEYDVDGGMAHEGVRTNKVFIVHGRDEGTREEVARFIERLDKLPVIIAEQASAGSTIIEKVEQNADVGFAIVLLTPDDEGGLKDGDGVRSRARQNVIFELGFFIGRLGRRQVCALTKGEVEIPSDYSGVVYIDMDGQSDWRIRLVRELKVAGYDVDANRII